MGKGRRKFDRRKNYELSLKVKLPLDLLKPFMVSLPLTSYTNAPAPSGQALRKRLLATNQLPVGWSVASDSGPCTTLYKVQCIHPQHTAMVTYSVVINNDLTWTLTMGSIPVLPSHLPAVPSIIHYVQQVVSLLLNLDGTKLCIGNQDEKYLSFAENHHHGNLYDQMGMT